MMEKLTKKNRKLFSIIEISVDFLFHSFLENLYLTQPVIFQKGCTGELLSESQWVWISVSWDYSESLASRSRSSKY